MKAENITCIQRAQFVLPFRESGEWRRKANTPWDRFLKKHDVTPDEVMALADYTAHRMKRSAALMDCLLNIHDDWEISCNEECIIMETVSMDFEAIIPQITEAGFNENDFILYSEYTRKWGML